MPRTLQINNFLHGQITSLEGRAIPRGAAQSSKNWLTAGDHIELRLGMARLGALVTGNGRISGLHRAVKVDGTEQLWRSRKRKIEYYTTAAAAWAEVSTNILPAAANDEDVEFANYAGLAGYQLWFNSPNGIFGKIMIANPGSYADQYTAAKNFLGWIAIQFNRCLLWNRGRTGSPARADETTPYGSYIDAAAYTTVTAENIGTGDGVTKTFTDTLDFKAGGSRRTCFAISVTDSVETFTDDRDGNLTGSLGGTGTINYMTGAISVTFKTAPAGSQAITCDYQWEDSASTGIADFSYSGTRTAGQGFAFRQDSNGSPLLAMPFYDGIFYCLHQRIAWTLELTNTDTGAANLPYREKVGIPFHRAYCATAEGIYYTDDTDQKKPRFRLLGYGGRDATKVIPATISQNLNLEDYRFDRGVVREYGDYVIFCGRHKSKTFNDTMWLYHRTYKSFDVVDYIASTLEEFEGKLVAGDDIADNVYELFSGYDDDGSLIPNFWMGKTDHLDINRLKRERKMIVRGLIQPDQNLDIYGKSDDGAWVLLGSVQGDGDYVDTGTKVTIGPVTAGRNEIGGGGSGSSGSVTASPYTRELDLMQLGDFYELTLKVQATFLGYVSVSSFEHYDIRAKLARLPVKYRS
ncbi:MAG: hypothetical protein PHI63_04775 [Patescibacteria group bacterium]|nr:hypothetical protein [Patescibacteria group bacterium]